MKHIITILFLFYASVNLFSQAGVSSEVVFDNSDLTMHNTYIRNGNISFEGNIASYAELADTKELNSENGTWCFLVNVTHATTGPGQSIISKTEAIGSYAGLHIFEDSGRIALQIKNYTNSQTLTIKADTVAGTGIHFISVTYENNKSVKLYIDGVLRKEAKPPYFIFSKNPMRIGCSLDTFWKPFDGELTGLEIYPTALSENDIACKFNARLNLSEKFFIYPNPAQSVIYIELPKIENVKLEMLNIEGKELFSYNYTGVKTINLNLETLAAGIYFIHVKGSEDYGIQKLVIRKN